MAATGGGPPHHQRPADDAPSRSAVGGAVARGDSLEQVKAELRATEAMLRRRLEEDKLKVQQSLLPSPFQADDDVVGPFSNSRSSSSSGPSSSSFRSFSNLQQSSGSFVGPTPPSGLRPSSASSPLSSSTPLPPSSFLPYSSVPASATTDPLPSTTPKPTGSSEPGAGRKSSTSSTGAWSARSRIGIDMLLNDTESTMTQFKTGNQAPRPKDRQ